MKYSNVIIFVVFCLYTCRESKVTLPDETEQLLQLERTWLQKEFALDTAYLSTLMDSSFLDISASEVHGKKTALANMYNNIADRKKNGIEIDSFRLEDHTVKFHENTAIVSMIVHSYRHSGDSIIQRSTRFYDVWVKKTGGWKAVSSQGTRVEE